MDVPTTREILDEILSGKKTKTILQRGEFVDPKIGQSLTFREATIVPLHMQFVPGGQHATVNVTQVDEIGILAKYMQIEVYWDPPATIGAAAIAP